MDIGYVRCSTTSQDPQMQVDALTAAGVAREDIYADTLSGKLADRPGLDKCLARLEPGDTLVVWKLDRLGRSVLHLVTTVTELGRRGVQFKSLTEGMDTTTNGGQLIFNIFAAIAQFERGLIQERTRAGLEVAHANGHFGGRPAALTPAQVAQARTLIDAGTPVAEVARSFKVSRAAVYRAFEREERRQS